MKIVVIVPIKKNSKRVFNKNFREINGIPLYRYLLDKLKNSNFDEIFIDSDSDEIKEYSLKNNFSYIDRLPKLKNDNANGNHLLLHHQKIIDADFYFQLFVTAPLLKIQSINSCIKILKEHDSILTCNSLYTWTWFKKKPINYNPKILPRSQDAEPIVIETTGLYGIKNDSLVKNQSRIGDNPYFFEVSAEESMDLDTEEDFDLLQYYIKKNLYTN